MLSLCLHEFIENFVYLAYREEAIICFQRTNILITREQSDLLLLQWETRQEIFLLTLLRVEHSFSYMILSKIQNIRNNSVYITLAMQTCQTHF